MDQLSQRVGLRETSKRALIQIVNPFMDFEQPKAGWFDTNESSSVVQCVKFSQVISAPVITGFTGNWDCNIFTTPLTNPTTFLTPASLANGLLAYSPPPNGAPVGGVVVVTAASGQALNLSAASRAPAPPNVGSATVQSALLSPTVDQLANAVGYLSGTSRVIGMGFEVHNTTSPLNIQGAVAVYKQPQPVFLDRLDVGLMAVGTLAQLVAPTLTAVFQGESTTFLLNDGPATLADAMLLPGSRQWEAKDGCMVVPTLASTEIPVQQLRNANVFFRDTNGNQTVNTIALGGAPTTGFTGCFVNPLFPVVTFAVPSVQIKLTQPLLHINNFNTSGAFFTGLSNSTTLVINTVYYIERFPTVSDKDLIVLAEPSPPYDSVAFDLYPILTQFMPPGCQVKDNADGDWFFEAVQSVAEFLKPALGFLPGPLGTLAGPFAGAVSSWAGNKLIERNKPGAADARLQLVAAQQAQQPVVVVQAAKKSVPKQGGLAKPKGLSKAIWAVATPKEKEVIVRRSVNGVLFLPNRLAAMNVAK